MPRKKRLIDIIFSLLGLIVFSGISMNQAKAGKLTVTLNSPQPNAGQSLLVKSSDTADLKATVSGNKGQVTYNWIVTGTSQTGIPNSATPGKISFDQVTPGGEYNITINVSDSVSTNSSNCTNQASTNLNVIDSGFYFDNGFTNDNIAGSFFIPSGSQVQNGVLPVASFLTVWAGPGVKMSGINAKDSSGGQWILTPGSGTTDGSGNFTNVISSGSSIALKNNSLTVNVSFSAGIEKFYSTDQEVYPAVFQDKFKATVYFTTKQDGYSTNNLVARKYYSKDGTKVIGSITASSDFLNAVRLEGYGRLNSPLDSKYNYLGYDLKKGGFYFEDTAARDNQSKVLHPTFGEDPLTTTHTCAYDHNIVPLWCFLDVINSQVINSFGSGGFQATDIGKKITGEHLDLYFGEDEPSKNALILQCTALIMIQVAKQRLLNLQDCRVNNMRYLLTAIIFSISFIEINLKAEESKDLYFPIGNKIYSAASQKISLNVDASLIPLQLKRSPWYEIGWHNQLDSILFLSPAKNILSDISADTAIPSEKIKENPDNIYAINGSSIYSPQGNRKKYKEYPCYDTADSLLKVTPFSKDNHIFILYSPKPSPKDTFTGSVCILNNVKTGEDIKSFRLEDVSAMDIDEVTWISDRYVICFIYTKRGNINFIIDTQNQCLAYGDQMKGVQYFSKIGNKVILYSEAADGSIISEDLIF